MESSSIILSILICHLFDRHEKFNNLYNKLNNQIKPFNDKVEIRFEGDNGEKTVGHKRNSLLSRAEGEYILFIDDDDDISDDYISSIMNALKEKSDCIGIEGNLISNKGDFLFRHSIQFQDWYTGSDGVFYRTPNHLNPVKRIIAQRILFPEINFGEDRHYSNGLKHYLKTETYINHPIYFYQKVYS